MLPVAVVMLENGLTVTSRLPVLKVVVATFKKLNGAEAPED